MDVRYSDPSVLIPIKCRFFFISFYVHHPNNSDNISVFLFALYNLVAKKKLFLDRKNIGEGFVPPKLCLCLLA